MLLPEDLWIGENVRLKKTGRIGTYEGKGSNGKFRINVEGKSILTTISNIEISEAPEANALSNLITELEEQTQHKSKFESVIDLHINEAEMLSREPVMIIRHQLRICKEFVDQAISHKLATVMIIHGKGKGELKKEVHHLLSHQKQVKYYHPINDGGATEVWFW